MIYSYVCIVNLAINHIYLYNYILVEVNYYELKQNVIIHIQHSSVNDLYIFINEYSIDNCVIKGLIFTDASFVTNENF